MTPKGADESVLVPTKFKVLLLLLAGSIIAGFNVYNADHDFRSISMSRVATIATALDTNKTKDLADTVTSSHVNYEYMHTALSSIKQANPDFHFVYLMNEKDGVIRFMADSEQKESSGYSAPGEVYNDATPAFKAIFKTGKPLTEGPVTDEYGTWVSMLVPMVSERDGSVVAVVGVDVPVSSYYTALVNAGALPLLAAVTLAIILAVSDSMRRRRVEAARFRSELVSIASHELRTPLTGLRWGSESLIQQNLAKEQMSLAHDIHDSVLRLQEGAEDILQMASLQSKHSQQLNIVPNDLTKMMRDVAANQKLAASERGVTIKLSDSWPQSVMANSDPLRMKRVFNNLLSNSVKYTRPNTEIIIGYHYKKDEGHTISMTDKGIGIPASEQDKIFSGFYRASNAIKAQVNGTGMGLYLSRTITEQHGGKVWLTSKEGVGTTVFILLP